MTAVGAAPQELYCRTLGTGPRPVMALHCTMAHSGAWRGLAEALEGMATVHAPDMFNHGRSPDWDGQGDFQDALVRAVVARMPGRCDVVGHSFGATAALRLAVRFPERVRSLTLIESVFFAPVGQDAPEVLAAEQAGSGPFHDALRAGNLDLAARLFNRGWGGGEGGGPPWDSLPEKLRKAMARGVRIVPHCAPAIIDDCHGLLAPGVLDAVRCPVLLLRGGQSAPIIAHVNDGLARRIPGAKSEVVEAAGHMLPITHPHETAAHLRAFWG